MHPSDAQVPRRGFLERLAAVGLSVTALGAAARPAAAQGPTAPRGAAAAGGLVPPDERWLDALRGKHRTVLDVETHRDGRVLAQAKNFLDAYEHAYGVPTSDLNLVVGVHGTAVPLVVADAAWAGLRLGAHYGITDPAARGASTRNVFTAASLPADGPVTAEQTIEALQRRGVLFLVCNNAIGGASRQLAAAGRGTAAEVRATIVGNLLPGVVLVPAMIVALSRLQERGVAYIYAT